ncbi:MAG: type VI secretion system protein TssL, long form [Marinobacter sp.]|uniref:type VI secretion system protein TssL, long form n=1 Tax=Marinobacter sp. TaxID=50741 RepID=UPI00299D06CD|nr:type VI secretion system protein TssL, long form [Marinobacter sp.]MDX1755961.1 type VI secretion system protein TssL, long form [Marinobacter sp.]
MQLKRVPVRKKRGSGSPAWIVTFADLATLLLTFFILLLSFAELDAQKYRMMAQSMAVAFGSSNVAADAVGGSPLTLIESDTVSLPEPMEAAAEKPELIDERVADEAPTPVAAGIVELASRLIETLEPQVASEALTVSYDTERVVIRFSEEATFRSGEATLKPDMTPILERVVQVLSKCTGDVLVAGYTDDRPIVSSRYRSNWDLSAARAVSVVHQLVLNRQVPADRVTAAGRAETNPLVPNDTPANRARNRRVEITIRDPECQPDVPTAELPLEILP